MSGQISAPGDLTADLRNLLASDFLTVRRRCQSYLTQLAVRKPREHKAWRQQTLLNHYKLSRVRESLLLLLLLSHFSRVRPHIRQPTRIPCPWDSPGKNTGVGCHFLFQCMKAKSESEVTQSCPTLSDPMACSLPGSSVHGIFQAGVLEWGATAFSEGVPEQQSIRNRALASKFSTDPSADPAKDVERERG